MNTRGSSTDQTTVCVGRWVWDSRGFWHWVGNCIDGWVGGPDASSRTYVQKPLSPPGGSSQAPPTSGNPNPPQGNPTPPAEGETKPPRTGPVTGPKDEEPPSEGECGNPVTINDNIQGQAGLDMRTWASLPELWQEVNVAKHLTVNANDIDYRYPPDVRVNKKGSIVKRIAGTADGVRMVAPYDMLDWQTLIGNRDEITTQPSCLTLGVYSSETANGIVTDGRIGLGSAHPTEAKIASGANIRLQFDGTGGVDTPDVHIETVDETGAVETDGKLYFNGTEVGSGGGGVTFPLEGSDDGTIQYSFDAANTTGSDSAGMGFDADDEEGPYLSDINGAKQLIIRDDEVYIPNKLTVDGIIDPTGLVLTEQASVPGTTPTGTGTIWVKNDDPAALMYSDDAGNDVPLTFPFWQAYSNTTQTGITSNTRLQLDTEIVNSDANYYSLDTVTNVGRLTVAVAGTYEVQAHFELESNDGTRSEFIGRLFLNGVQLTGASEVHTYHRTTAQDTTGGHISRFVTMAASDYLEMMVDDRNGGAATVAQQCYMMVRRVA